MTAAVIVRTCYGCITFHCLALQQKAKLLSSPSTMVTAGGRLFTRYSPGVFLAFL